MRVAKRLPRKTVAAKAKIDVSYLAALEKGSRNPPTLEKLEQILDGLGASEQEKVRLSEAAFFARVKSQIVEVAPLHVRKEAKSLVASIPKLTAHHMRVVQAMIDVLIADQIPTEVKM